MTLQAVATDEGMIEIIDIFDANLTPVGVLPRAEAHRTGAWHRTFHLWLVEPQGRLLFQRRSPHVQNFPGKLDVTAAGHLHHGEDLLDGLREAREELGVAIAPTEARFLGYRTEATDLGDYRNREHQGVFLARAPVPLAHFAPDPAEVNGLFAIALDQLFALWTDAAPAVTAEAWLYDDLGNWTATSQQVTKADFLPRIPAYYLAAAIMAERFLEGRSPLAIG